MAPFALDPRRDPRPVSLWSPARFGESGRLIHGAQLSLQARLLEFGRGYRGENASFAFAVKPEGLAVRDFGADFGQGRLSGGLTVARQGSLASFIGEGAVQNAALRQ